jgi:hypothetical protein
MKTIVLKTKYFLLSLIVVLAFSCSAEDGAPGEQGLQGVQGPQGPQGEQGEKGDPGESGNGNVISVVLENETLALGENEFSVPELTQDIFDNGLVYAYITGDPSIWFALPVSQLQNLGTEEDPVLVSVTVVEMVGIEVGNVILSSLIEGDVDIRFVLVPGSVAQASSFDVNDFL